MVKDLRASWSWTEVADRRQPASERIVEMLDSVSTQNGRCVAVWSRVHLVSHRSLS